MSRTEGPDDKDLIVRRVNFGCQHRNFDVDPSAAYVQCRDCGEKLDPMWVLYRIACDEYTYRWRLNGLREDAKKAQQKNRCKCEKCGQMTRIEK